MAIIKDSYTEYTVKGRDRFIEVKIVTECIDEDTGEVEGTSNHRDTIEPDDDVKAAKYGLTNAANVAWPASVRANWRAKKAAQNPG